MKEQTQVELNIKVTEPDGTITEVSYNGDSSQEEVNSLLASAEVIMDAAEERGGGFVLLSKKIQAL